MTDLATIDGKNLEAFKKDPVNALLYSMAMEKQKYGLEIARKAYNHYFLNNESNDIVKQFGEVWIFNIKNIWVNNLTILFQFNFLVYIWYLCL